MQMAVENFNPVFLLSPAIPIIFSFALLFYWRYRKSFRWMILVYALIAYAGAIFIKSVFQYFTALPFINYFGSVSVATGLYYGLQTSLLEVGLAYVVIRYAIRRHDYESKYASSYGISLSFWENGILLGVYPLINLALSYILISANLAGLSQLLSDTLMKSEPGLFAPTLQALPSIGLSGIERTSSLFAHYSWGVLVFLSVTRKKVSYFLIALPMGLIDALVPYARVMGIYRFEAILFFITVIFLAIVILVQKRNVDNIQESSPPSNSGN